MLCILSPLHLSIWENISLVLILFCKDYWTVSTILSNSWRWEIIAFFSRVLWWSTKYFSVALTKGQSFPLLIPGSPACLRGSFSMHYGSCGLPIKENPGFRNQCWRRDREKKETPQTVPGSEEKGSYVCQCIDLAWILYVLIPLGICEKHSGLFLHVV